MVEFTFLELHVEDVQLPAGPFAGGESESAARTGAPGSSDEDEASSVLPSLMAVLAVVGVALAARRWLGGTESEAELTESTDPLAAD